MMESCEYLGNPSEYARSHLFYPLLSAFSRSDAQFFFERKHYPAYEIVYVTEGKGKFKIGDQWTDLVEGDCLIYDMRYPHAYRADTDDPYHMLYVVFDGPDMDYFWRKWFNAPNVVLHGLPREHILQTNLWRIIDLMSEDHKDEQSLSTLLYDSLARSFGLRTDTVTSTLWREPDALKRAKTYLDESFPTILSVKEVADHAGFSLFYFIRQFKKHYGFTPKEYLLHKKIHLAKRLLIASSQPVNDILTSCGFSSYNTFLHAFMGIEKCSPSVFRKNWKRNSF